VRFLSFLDGTACSAGEAGPIQQETLYQFSDKNQEGQKVAETGKKPGGKRKKSNK
jgi:hypothetical protein